MLFFRTHLGALVALCIFFVLQVSTVKISHAQKKNSSASIHVVKAGFILKLPLFITWPEEMLPESKQPVIVALFGGKAIQSEIKAIAELSRIHDRQIVIKSIDSIEEIGGAHVLFIGRSASKHLEAILDHLKGTSVITIGDGPHYAKRGVMFNLIIENGKVRIVGNRKSIEESKLGLSYRLKNVVRFIEGA